ncbi:MAG: hypothetical protein QNK11_01320 [Legionella sp.]|nr:hypothetical protein [Legionella sp.]
MPILHVLPSKLFVQRVLSEIRRTQFSGKGIIQHTQAYFKDSDAHKESFNTLHSGIIHAPDLLYRGTSGFQEVTPLLEKNIYGREPRPMDKNNYNLVEYVRDNDNTNFLSFSSCPETVRPYAVGLSIIPSLGSILVNTYPKVITIPQKLLYFKSPMIERDITQQINNSAEGSNYQPIKPMLADNNETTAILYGPKGEDWRPKPSTDLKQINLLYGVGKALELFTNASQPLYVNEWINEDFKKRAISVEVTLGTPNDLLEMTPNARDLGLLAEGERFLTMEDASAIWRNNNFDDIKVHETVFLSSVPETIQIGDEAALVDYIKTEKLPQETIQADPSAPFQK